VHVHIERVELRPPRQRSAPKREAAPAQRARGFGEFALARRFLDRGWS
jgi:hypothetical protein